MSSMGAFNSNNNFDDDDDDDNDNSDGSTRTTDYEKYWFHFVRLLDCALTHTRSVRSIYEIPCLRLERATLLTDN